VLLYQQKRGERCAVEGDVSRIAVLTVWHGDNLPPEIYTIPSQRVLLAFSQTSVDCDFQFRQMSWSDCFNGTA
jgi:hypothetical protein